METGPEELSGTGGYPTRRSTVHITILILAVAAAYANSFRGVFQFDDFRMIVDNPVVHGLGAWYADLLKGGIRPLLKLAYLPASSAGGVFWFHLLNVSVHVANTLLVFLLTRRLASETLKDKRTAPGLPLVVALIFGLHPIQTEAVTYISGGSVSLMSFFYLGSLLCYLCGRAEGRRVLAHVAGPILFFLAFLTREMAVTLPMALLVIEVSMRGGPSWMGRMKQQAVYWFLTCALVLGALLHPGYRKLLSYSFSLRSVYEAFFTQIHGLCCVLGHAFVPWSLNIDPDIPVVRSLSFPVAVEIGVVVAALLIGQAIRKRHPLPAFAVFWFLLQALLPYLVLGRDDIMNERHLYLGNWGLSLLIGWALLLPLPSSPRLRSSLRLAALCLVLCLGVLTVARNGVFRGEVLLWEDAAAKSPRKVRVHNNLGFAYYLAGDYEQARRAYERALELNPASTITRNNVLLLDRCIEDRPTCTRR